MGKNKSIKQEFIVLRNKFINLSNKCDSGGTNDKLRAAWDDAYWDLHYFLEIEFDPKDFIITFRDTSYNKLETDKYYGLCSDISHIIEIRTDFDIDVMMEVLEERESTTLDELTIDYIERVMMEDTGKTRDEFTYKVVVR